MLEVFAISKVLFIAIAIIVVAGYVAVLLMLGWESHSKYGTGYYWVGICLVGVILAVINYRYWSISRSSAEVNYPLWAMILSNVFLVFLGLWAYLVYHSIFLHKSKAMRAGARLVTRVFAEDQAATGTGRFRDQLRGWEGDVRLDILLVEGKFSEAEDYLEGVIMKASSERDKVKAQFYEQYRSVIAREQLMAESGTDKDSKTVSQQTHFGGDVDIKRGEKIKKEDLPEGWVIPD